MQRLPRNYRPMVLILVVAGMVMLGCGYLVGQHLARASNASIEQQANEQPQAPAAEAPR